MSATVTDAIVLQAFPYGETSRIVRFLTRSAGVQSAIAKGAMRPRSQYAVLEPFAEGGATIHIRPTRELQTLAGFDVVRSRHRLGRDLLRFGGASLVSELVLRTASEDPDPVLYDAVSSGLDRLMEADADALEVCVLGVAWAIVTELGFMAELESCIACGRGIDPEADVSFDYAAGGVRCDGCAVGMPGRRIPPRARTALSAFSRGETAEVATTEGHWRLLSLYLEHHLLEGAPLKSMHFLAAGVLSG